MTTQVKCDVCEKILDEKHNGRGAVRFHKGGFMGQDFEVDVCSVDCLKKFVEEV